MKRLVAIVLVGALSTPGCALPRARGPRMVHGPWMWSNVVSLPPNTLIRVFTRVAWHEGELIAADDVDVRIRTKHADVVLPADLVLRVDRLLQGTQSRAQRALVSAAVGTVAMVGIGLLVMQFLCLSMSGRTCWAPPNARGVVALAALYGGYGAIADDARTVTIYVHP
jgi:hypothetical protein